MLKKYATTSVLLAGSMSVMTSVALADDATPPPQQTANVKPAESAPLMEELVITAKFVSESAKSALKQDVGILDTPASVDNYSASFMRAIETTNVTDLYNYMTGLQRGGATGYDLSIRGFKTAQTDKNAILVDGLPGLATRYGSPPTINTESIDVVRGPASVLYGQDQPGGFVNMITKKPSATAAGVVTVTESAYDGDGISIGHDLGTVADLDFTGAFNSGQSLLYRLILENVHKESFREGVYEHSYYIAPSLTWVVSKDTTATVAVEVRHREAGYDNFLVAPNKDVHLIASPTTVYQSPNDILPEFGRSETFTLDHAITSDINWHTAVRSITANDSAVGYDQNSVFLLPATTKAPILPAEWVVQRRAREQFNERSYNFIDSNVTMPLSLGPVENRFLFGVNGGVDTTDFNRIQFLNGPVTGALARPGPTSINVTVYNPITNISPAVTSYPPAAGLNDRYTRSETYAGYLSDLITLTEQWKLNLGVRDSSEQQYAAERKLTPKTAQSIKTSKALPTAGLMFEPSGSWTLYSAYSTSYVPVPATAQDVNGNYTFKPVSAHQVEVGSKLDKLQGRLSVTVAAFDIHSDNVIEAALCNPGVVGTCSLQVGQEHSKGGELEVNTHIIEGWQALLGYSYTNAIVSKSDSTATAPLVGDRLTNSSLNNVHFWSRYDVGSGPLRGLGVGLGAFHVSSHAGTLPSASDKRLLLLPGYTVVDTVVYYSLLGRYDFTLKVGNLLDKVYYEGVNSTTNDLGVVPGSPRYLQLSVRVPLY
jgi:iron complex outermembrane receptor protein